MIEANTTTKASARGAPLATCRSPHPRGPGRFRRTSLITALLIANEVHSRKFATNAKSSTCKFLIANEFHLQNPQFRLAFQNFCSPLAIPPGNVAPLVSNRYTKLLEIDLSHSKQTMATHSNRHKLRPLFDPDLPRPTHCWFSTAVAMPKGEILPCVLTSEVAHE